MCPCEILGVNMTEVPLCDRLWFISNSNYIVIYFAVATEAWHWSVFIHQCSRCRWNSIPGNVHWWVKKLVQLCYTAVLNWLKIHFSGYYINASIPAYTVQCSNYHFTMLYSPMFLNGVWQWIDCQMQLDVKVRWN